MLERQWWNRDSGTVVVECLKWNSDGGTVTALVEQSKCNSYSGTVNAKYLKFHCLYIYLFFLKTGLIKDDW